MCASGTHTLTRFTREAYSLCDLTRLFPQQKGHEPRWSVPEAGCPSSFLFVLKSQRNRFCSLTESLSSRMTDIATRVRASRREGKASFCHSLHVDCHQRVAHLGVGPSIANDLIKNIPNRCAQVLGF